MDSFLWGSIAVLPYKKSTFALCIEILITKNSIYAFAAFDGLFL